MDGGRDKGFWWKGDGVEMGYFSMTNQIDPGTSIDVYDGHEWIPGWVLIRCAFRCHCDVGDFFSYGVYQYPRHRDVAVVFVRRAKGRSD